MEANHQHSSAKCHSEFLLSSRQIRPSNLFVFCLVFLLICLNFVALATPNKMDNKVEKTSAEQQQGVEQHEKHQKLTTTTTTVAADVEQEEIQTCTVRVQVVKKVVGKCVRLRGGNSACQTDDFLDPVNEDCIFE